ncbi:MAG: hypothetical protein ACM3XM_09070 [Mycobacterium leprae]
MSDKLEITLRIALDRSGLAERLDGPVDNDTAFFILGLVHAQLTAMFGDENCMVELNAASGIDPSLIREMNGFARRHKQALETLRAQGNVLVAEWDIVEVLQLLQDVSVTPVGERWLVELVTGDGPELVGADVSRVKH